MKDKGWLSAFKRLPFRDRVILITFCSAAIGAMIVIMFVFLAKGRVLEHSKFPKAMLSKVNSKVYSVSTFEELPYTVQFPDTDYFVGVPNVVSIIRQDGASITYSDEVKIILSVKSAPMTISEAVSASWIEYIKGNELSSSEYTSKLSETGYANSLVFDYEVGILVDSESEYTVLTYSYDTGSGHILYMSAAVSNDDAIDKASDILHKMLYTLYKGDSSGSTNVNSMGYSGDDEGMQPGLASSSESEEGAVSGDASKESSWVYSDVSTDGVSIKDFEADYIHSELPINNGVVVIDENPVIEEVITVDSAYVEKTVIFFIEYTDFSYTPTWAMLVSPQDEVYEPSYFNSSKDGLVYFKISGPMEGEWVMMFPNGNLGSYSFGFAEESEFEG